MILKLKNSKEEWLCNMKPHGAQGYEWLLIGKEFSFRIGNWLTPSTKPSIIAEIHSETLWRMGPENAVDKAISIIEGADASIVSIKPSRVDLCVDVLIPEILWNEGLKKLKVGRANQVATYDYHGVLNAIYVGKKKIKARLYDKPLEIKQSSKKSWMYDIWGLKKVPEGYRIIRVEFEILREVIKELGIENIKDLFDHLESLWKFCTLNWLKFQTRPGKHHTQRKTVKLWRLVQDGFSPTGNCHPLIRQQAISDDIHQIIDQIYGLVTKFIALVADKFGYDFEKSITLKKALNEVFLIFEAQGREGDAFQEEVFNKRSKYHRSLEKAADTHQKRLSMGLPSNIPYKFTHRQKKG